MFNKNFVMAIKANGKVLREFDGSTYIPFGSQYSILLKNLSTTRAKVTVRIDGDDVLDGNSLILSPQENLELKRFIKNGNMDSGNAFKFIEKTEKIEKYRGNKVEDGLITIEYEFENLPYAIAGRGIISTYPYDFQKTFKKPQVGDYGDYYNHISGNASFGDHSANYSQAVSSSTLGLNQPRGIVAKNTAGITAPGAITEQKFTRTSTFIGNGQKFTMTLQLQGVVDGQIEVKKPVTVTRLTTCSMCGTSVRQTAKFCHECGSSAEIV